ncbi:DcaP family trimeric outer membrane transporter [Flavobacterium sp.]|jgi:hypothetical protein|uniref:DcaP family trimeric outer membrane transporter n=1 Tax=Flavobacterium sp. TaxID=239 RepID=UPI0037C06DB8
MKKVLIVAVLLISALSFSQGDKPIEKPFKTELYGFARVDYSWDTRQSAQVREYHLNLWPLDEKIDANNNDINAANASNFLSVVSRLGVKASGPDVWGAKVSGVLEGDFFGNTQQSIGLLRLRHAYAKLDWEKTALTFGQTWYPTFIPEVFPGVANFSTGIPFNPFGWATQFRVDQKLNEKFRFSFIAYKDREFGAFSADGNQNSPVYNSVLPAMHGKMEFRNKSVLAGIGAEFYPNKPLIESNGVQSEETLNSTSILAYFKYNNEKFHIKAYGISGENLHHLVMLGGYASYSNGASKPVSYEGIRTNSFWLDIASNNKNTAPGFFFGYTNQEGTGSSNAATTIYARGITATRGVKDIWRASARVDFKQNKFRLTPEVEYTAATHGSTQSDLSISGNENKVGNFRATVSAVYSF